MKWKKYLILFAIAVSGFLLFRRLLRKRQSTTPQSTPTPSQPITSPTGATTPVPTRPVVQGSPRQACGRTITWPLVYENALACDARIANRVIELYQNNVTAAGISANNVSEAFRTIIAGRYSSGTRVQAVQDFLNVFPKLVSAQSRHETCNYLSRLANVQNNFFGMGCATSRQNVIEGCQSDFAAYPNLENSVLDLFLWFNARSQPWRNKMYVDILNVVQRSGPLDVDQLCFAYANVLKNGPSAFSYFTDSVENYARGMAAAYRRIG